MKKHGFLICIAFLSGIWLAHMSGSEFLMNYGILNSYYLNQYAYSTISYEDLSGTILWERGKMVFILLLLRKGLNQEVFWIIVEGIISILFGFLLAAAALCLGAAGIAVILAGLFPQWLFYLAAFWVYLEMAEENRYLPWKTQHGFLARFGFSEMIHIFFMVVLFSLGVLSEIYLNPILLKLILKIL